ncbi:MAG TPA: hypothetical protein VJV79_05555 [Polyangiaceae bacterium]|nr:hypothetical protein [Polyangiaceae bacterium]
MNPYSIVSCFVALGAIACSGAADIPDTPDLSRLLAAYEQPTASLDETTVAMALSSSPPLKELAAGIDAAKYILHDDVDNASSSSSGSTGSRLRVQGSISLHIRCPGEHAESNFDEAVNGSITLTLALADNRIRRSFGGVAKACVLHGEVGDYPARVRLDGPIEIDMGSDIGLGKRWSGELLASLPGELRVGDLVFQSISARRTPSGQFQHLVRIEGETIVLALGDDGITIRDGSGVWFCREGASCARR